MTSAPERARAVPPFETAGLTAAAMLSFALNSLLCRAALEGGHADAASFTTIRLASGALALGLLSVATALAFPRASARLLPVAPRPLVLGALLVLLVGAVSALRWLRRLSSGSGAEREAFARIGVERRRLLVARLALGALALAATLAALLSTGAAWPLVAALALAFAAEAAGRLLFYEARVRSGL